MPSISRPRSTVASNSDLTPFVSGAARSSLIVLSSHVLVKSASGRAADEAGDAAPGREYGGENAGDQVRLDAGATRVAARRGHRSVLAVPGGRFGHASLPDRIHAESLARPFGGVRPG